MAYADFVTAMMSLFIVLWLMGSSDKVKRAVAGYFNDPKGTSNQLGTTMTGTGETVSQVSTKSLEKLKEKLEQEIKARKDLEKLSKQIEITVTPEGLRIELIEGKNGTFYEIGSAKLSDERAGTADAAGGGVEDAAQCFADGGSYGLYAVFERQQLQQLGPLGGSGQLCAADFATGRRALEPGDAGARVCGPDAACKEQSQRPFESACVDSGEERHGIGAGFFGGEGGGWDDAFAGDGEGCAGCCDAC